MSTTETALLAWEQGKYGGYHGTAGEIHLFTVALAARRDAPRWQMRTVLPGLTGKTWTGDNEDALKGAAEGVLAGWIARVTQTPDTTGETR